jgi:hypothetical protein
MVSFTFSAEQIRSAPTEVRRWMEAEIVRALTGAPAAAAAPRSDPAADPAEGLERALATGTASEMQETFQRIADDSIIARVFFELARDQGISATRTAFHVVNLVDVMRHLQLAEAQQLLACLDTINQAFQQVRRDPQASLFALDEAGHIYLHELTYHSIRQVWQQLVMAHPWPASAHMGEAPLTGAAAPTGRQEPTLEPIMRSEHAFAGPSND